MVHTRGQWMFRLLALVIILIHTSLCLKAISPGQNDQGKQKVSIVANNRELQDVFRDLKQQTGLTFFYSETLINTKEKITVHMVNKTLDEVLQKVLGSRGLVWEYTEKLVGIKKDERHRSSVSIDVTGDTTVTSQAITGKVVSPDGTPIPGATVLLKNSKIGATTDGEGNFSLPTQSKNEVLIISSIGYEQREISVKGRTILVQLNVAVNDLNETVIIAYGTSTKGSNVGAISTVKGSDISDLPNRSFDRSLQGQVPGLLVTSGSGQPGGGTSNFIIRGISTGAFNGFGSTIRQPLIVVDGVPLVENTYINRSTDLNAVPASNPLAQINPNDVATYSVLKDAAAIALYGSKASNGVILITTKKGQKGSIKYNFNHQTDIAIPIIGRIKTLNKDQYLGLIFDTYKNANPTLWNDASITADLQSKFPTYINNNGQKVFYDPQDWTSALFKDPAITMNNELSASGGTEATKYYFNVGYVNQSGIIKHTDFDRLSLRYNFVNDGGRWLKLGLNSTLTYTTQNYQGLDEGQFSPGGYPYVISPLSPIYLQNGNYDLFPYFRNSPRNNPVAVMDYNKYQTSAYRALGNLFAEVRFNSNLSFRSDVGLDLMISKNDEKADPRLWIGTDVPPGTGEIYSSKQTRSRLIVTNTLRYQKTLNRNHFISMLLGQEAQKQNQESLSALKRGLQASYLEDLSAATDIYSAGGFNEKTNLSSLFAQVSYEFKQKYNFSLSGRRDGSSKFGERNRYGNYWSVGAGWLISNEQLIKKNVAWINMLKLRGSLGTAGNSSTITATTRFSLLSFLNNNGTPTAVLTNTPGNPEIQWEKTFNSDIGLEFKIFERFSGTVDIYKKNITDLLYVTNLPGSTGFSIVTRNVGKMENKGLEIGLSYDVIRKDDFGWNIAANWSTNKNTLIKANQPLSSTGINYIDQEGENYNSFYLVRWAGVNPDDGKPQWLDKDGKVTANYSTNDRVIVGKPQPDGYGGVTNTLNYKAFELTAFFYYQYGFQIFDGTLATLLNDGGGSLLYVNQLEEALDYWKNPGDQSENPRRFLGNTDGGTRASTRYLFDGDFIRLKNLTLRYGLPTELIERIGINRAQVYVSGNNLALWTKYKGNDPENTGVAGSSNFPYPQARSYAIGLNISF